MLKLKTGDYVKKVKSNINDEFIGVGAIGKVVTVDDYFQSVKVRWMEGKFQKGASKCNTKVWSESIDCLELCDKV